MDRVGEVEILSTAPGGAVEGGLVSETQWGAVRGLRERGVSVRRIARELGLDRKTVRKWLRQEWREQRRRCRGRELDRFAEFLRGRAPEVGFNAVVLHREARALGYEGSYPALARYVQPWREGWRGEELGTVRFETGPGEQSQVDWGSTWVWLGETRVRVHLFVMVLGYSRRIFARGYESEGLDPLLGAHERAFAHFGGRTRTILYDNPRTIVRRKDEATGYVEWNASFKDRMDFYGVEIRLCRRWRAKTKGKVESGVKYVKRNALAGRRFQDLEELNAWLLEWCLTIADRRVHGTTHERPAERFAREEAKALVAVDRRLPTARERFETRIVPRDGYVAVLANRYPVPLAWVRATVDVRVTAQEVILRHGEEEPVRHPRLVGKHQVARWSGPPRTVGRPERMVLDGPPQLDLLYLGTAGDVEVRPLARYEAIAEGVRP
jgi:transposase